MNLFRAYFSNGDFSVPPPKPKIEVSVKLWTPSLRQRVPPGLPKHVYTAWWIFHYAHVFSNHDYLVAQAWHQNKVIHSVALFPAWFRFPFMAKADLSLGDGWADPAFRGNHVHPHVMRFAVDHTCAPGRMFWGVIDETNKPPMRAIERIGFDKYHLAVRVPRMGISPLGAYRLLDGEPHLVQRP